MTASGATPREAHRDMAWRGVDSRHALILAAGVACAALVAAFAGQHMFGLEPCVLCVWQRIPYAMAAVLAVAAIMVPVGPGIRAYAVLGLAGIFAAGAALAAYHVGVEEHWWTSIAACGSQGLQELRFEELATGGAPALKPCDQVDWRFLGISLAGYNGLLSGTMAITFAVIARTLIRRETA